MAPAGANIFVIRNALPGLQGEDAASDARRCVLYGTGATADTGKQPSLEDGQAGDARPVIDLFSNRRGCRPRLPTGRREKLPQRRPAGLLVVARHLTARNG